MKLRIKIFVGLTIAFAVVAVASAPGQPGSEWTHFFLYLVAILLSSGMKVALPKNEGTMTVNFPLIFLGIIQLSPLQAVCLAVCSVLAQCGIRVIHRFTLMQIAFNVANVTTATLLASQVYRFCLAFLGNQTGPTLAVAAIVYFVVNTVPVSLVIAWNSDLIVFKVWRQTFTWYLPFYLVGALLAAVANFIEHQFGWMTALLLIPAVYTLYRAYTDQIEIIRDRERHVEQMEALQLRTIEGLAMAIEAKDENTHQHLMRVRVYVSEIGRLMNLEAPIMKALQTAALLHDIGKLAIPEHILNKPGKLTPEEFEKMKIHPVVGADMLKRVDFPYPVVPIVRGHHEAWDGSGYPDGLKGEEIPIGARILTAVDCFDALASERPYRRALPLAEAMAFVKSKAGVQFDPAVVALLDEHFERLESLARERSHDLTRLNTDLVVERGIAPGAGFESVLKSSESSSSNPNPAKSQAASLELIAAASQEEKIFAALRQELGSSLSELETCSMTYARLKKLIPFECFAVYRLKDAAVVVPEYIDGSCAEAFTTQPIPLGEGVSGWVAQNGRTIVNGNPTVETNYLRSTKLFQNSSSALSVPLIGTNEATFGALTVYSRSQTAFSFDHLRILQAIQPNLTSALENARLYRDVQADSRIDHLTQLWNTRHFFKLVDIAIEEARSAGETFSIVICDLNSFKAVNDCYGHLRGNALLRSIADEFRLCCRPADPIARLGGDEFAFLFAAIDQAGTESKLAMLRDAVQRACATQELSEPITGSLGVALYPADGVTAEALLGVADSGMYVDKRVSYERRLGGEQSAIEGLSAV